MSEIVRKLATIERIISLMPIPEADRIEVAQIRGWQVVVQKGLYQVNDLVCFFEIDSFLPVEPQYEFLRKTSFRSNVMIGEGFRIKTIKMKGQVSQGLILPLTEFPDIFIKDVKDCNWYLMQEIIPFDNDWQSNYLREGDDVTELLGVKKWEAPLSGAILRGNALGLFPSFIRKTDEERFQNLGPKDFAPYLNDDFVVTLKMDGSSMTVFRKDDHIGVCSRNLEVKDEEDNAMWAVAKRKKLIWYLENYPKNIAIQGEFVGPGVRGNPQKLKVIDFYIFNVWDIDEQEYLDWDELDRLITLINLQISESQPYEYNEALNVVSSLPAAVRFMVEERDNSDWKLPVSTAFIKKDEVSMLCEAMQNGIPYPIEGVVFKSKQHPDFSFKFISPAYLLKQKD